MILGLDLGTSELRVVWRAGSKLQAIHTRNAYTLLPDDVECRLLLTRAAVPFAAHERNLVIMGDPAVSISRLVRTPLISILATKPGEAIDPFAAQVLRVMLEQMIPRTQGGEQVCGCVGLRPVAAKDPTQPLWNVLHEALQPRGYRLETLSPGKALALAELANTSFTGLTISFGGGRTTFSVCRQGRELLSGDFPRGGDWIDQQFATYTENVYYDLAGNEQWDVERVRHWKHQRTRPLLDPEGPDETLLLQLFRESLTESFQQIADELRSLGDNLKHHHRIPMLLGGGMALIPGFRELVAQILRQHAWPLELGEIRLASSQLTTQARGALIHASLEASSQSRAA